MIQTPTVKVAVIYLNSALHKTHKLSLKPSIRVCDSRKYVRFYVTIGDNSDSDVTGRAAQI